MDAFLTVLAGIGVDKSVFTQFAIYITLLIVMKYLLFDRLKVVIENRESKTTGLIEAAAHQEHQAQILAETYNKKIDEAYRAIQQESAKEKEKVLEKNQQQIKAAEDAMNQQVDKSREEYQRELNTRKEVIAKDVDLIAESLISNLSK